jgi:hypothetical protein
MDEHIQKRYRCQEKSLLLAIYKISKITSGADVQEINLVISDEQNTIMNNEADRSVGSSERRERARDFPSACPVKFEDHFTGAFSASLR